MAKGAVIGLAAHVDAGKTTLSEAMLFLSGALRRQGRVDHGDSFLDTEKMEKERGITIFSKEARLTWKKANLTLVDTPGHTDFSGETERALSIMDLAVLVISASEGVQSHTLTLWNLMERQGLPVVLFINKTDAFHGSREELLAGLSARLSDRLVPFPDPDPEKMALCDESALDVYLREGEIPPARIQALIRGRRLFPCFFGAALRNEGVEDLLDFLAAYDPALPVSSVFGARVYKVARDPQGARLVFLRVTGGSLSPRDTLAPALPAEEELPWKEKAAELRLYSGARYVTASRAEAGQLCCVVGLSKALPGDGLGAGTPAGENRLQPCYACRLVPEQGTDLHRLLDCLRLLEEEEPLLQVEYVEGRREIRIHSMGDVYLEVLQRQLQDRFGLRVGFAESSVLYRETIAAPVEGAGHYEPLRHYAEVHLLLSPLPRGSGLRFESAVSTDDLALNWQRLILTHLRERTHPGVLTGSPVTDMRITLTAGRAHLKHTEGGDFRQATYRAVRQGLMKAQCILLEPWLQMEIRVPESAVGRVMSDLSQMGGRFGQPVSDGGECVLTAEAPASACAGYSRMLSTFTHGQGRLSAVFSGYAPCAAQKQAVAESGYDPLRDLWNPADSVFCSHGAGVTVPWDEADSRMHLPFLKDAREETSSVPAAGGSASRYRGTAEEDQALAAIFEKTYGPIRSRQLLAPPRASDPAPPAAAKTVPDLPEVLLVDGYNVLFSWEEWKPMPELESARRQLMDLLCDYAGATGKDVILVFDAYRVPGNPGRAEKYHNIFVVYTRESQTADAYIEQSTYLARNRSAVRVVTGDGPEQLIASGNSAMRTSAREFREECIRVRGSIAAFLRDHYRPAQEKALERAYKEAWKKKH